MQQYKLTITKFQPKANRHVHHFTIKTQNYNKAVEIYKDLLMFLPLDTFAIDVSLVENTTKHIKNCHKWQKIGQNSL